MGYGAYDKTELGSRVVLDNGYKYDRFTGVLLGQHLEPDKYNVHSAPLFVYNRTDRFYLLCQRSMPGPYSDINMCVKMFQRLEDVWNDRKDKYKPRKYFLSQKLLCKEICIHLKFRCIIMRAIQDKNRLAAQMLIYADLFDYYKCLHDCISENNPNSINFVHPPNFPLRDGKSRLTPLEILEQIATSKPPWHFNLP